MRRALIVLMLLLVQFQLVWGAAASYCGHETKASVSKHFGHHEHRHQGAEPTSAATDEDGGGLPAVHADCESCHLGTSGTLPTPSTVLAKAPGTDHQSERGHRYRSYVPSGLERPDRS